MDIRNSREDALQIFNDNKKLAYFILNKYFNPYITEDSKDDLHQVALLALWKSCLTYDKNLNITISTYASKSIINELIMYIGRNKKKKNFNDSIVSYDTMFISDYENDSCPFNEVLADKSCMEDNTINSILLDEIIKDCETLADNDEHNEVFKDYLYSLIYGEPCTQIDIAKNHNLSQAQVSRIIRGQKKRIKSKYEGQY